MLKDQASQEQVARRFFACHQSPLPFGELILYSRSVLIAVHMRLILLERDLSIMLTFAGYTSTTGRVLFLPDGS